jgi:hypothetical protein
MTNCISLHYIEVSGLRNVYDSKFVILMTPKSLIESITIFVYSMDYATFNTNFFVKKKTRTILLLPLIIITNQIRSIIDVFVPVLNWVKVQYTQSKCPKFSSNLVFCKGDSCKSSVIDTIVFVHPL